MRRSETGGRRLRMLAVAALAAGAVSAGQASAAKVIAEGLDDPRGIGVVPGQRVFVAESLSGEITALHRRGHTYADRVRAQLPPGTVDVASRKRGEIYAVVGGPPEEPGQQAGLLVRVKDDGFKVIADIAGYQVDDPDPHDLEDAPEESNPNGLAVLRHGHILVVDAANNDLLLVRRNGRIETVARFPTRKVDWPEELGEGPPDGRIDAEAVPTAVAVGHDGAWYVSELRGFPFTPGTSRVWRIDPDARDADCPSRHCRVFARGFTSVIDVAFGKRTMYVLEIVKEGLLGVELFGAPPIGALWAVKGDRKRELARGDLLAPGGVAVAGRRHHERLFVTTGTVFGPGGGQVVLIRANKHHD